MTPKLDTNLEPRSETILSGKPCWESTQEVKSVASPGADNLVVVGMKIDHLVSRSTMTRMELKLLEGGRGSIKSMERCRHGTLGTSRDGDGDESVGVKTSFADKRHSPRHMLQHLGEGQSRYSLWR